MSNWLKDYLQFLSFRTVSTDPKFRDEIEKALDWFIELLKQYGFKKAEVLELSDLDKKDYLPMVYAEYIVDKNLPTILFYGHYDVQPANEPEWESDPFIPVIKDNAVYARGASDNKGRLFAILVALREYFKNIPDPQKRFNIKLLVEGEEETGSKNVKRFLEQYKEQLSADYIFINDASSVKGKPTIIYGLRGLLYLDLEIQTGEKELHSGGYGNLVLNAPQLASYVIYKLKDIWRNSIRIERLKKHIRKPSKKEIEYLASISPSWEDIKESTKAYVVTPYRGQKKDQFKPLHLTGLRPSLDVHGIVSGVTTPVTIKTNIPHKVLVKFSLRLVPYLTPELTEKLLKQYIDKILRKFKGVKYKLTPLIKLMYFYEDPYSPHINAFKEIMQQVYNEPAVLIPYGATIGIVSALKETYPNSKILIHGLRLDSDNVHAANENFRLDILEQGAQVVKTLLDKFSTQ